LSLASHFRRRPTSKGHYLDLWRSRPQGLATLSTVFSPALLGTIFQSQHSWALTLQSFSPGRWAFKPFGLNGRPYAFSENLSAFRRRSNGFAYPPSRPTRCFPTVYMRTGARALLGFRPFGPSPDLCWVLSLSPKSFPSHGYPSTSSLRQSDSITGYSPESRRHFPPKWMPTHLDFLTTP
jgi:hypothetical protein